MPQLTIQLCTYNRSALLARVLAALFDQTLPAEAYEVVLVDDGSTDDTRATIERLRPLARCAFVAIHQPNAGLARSRNVGLAQARGERVCFIDDDVLPTPVFAAEHVASDRRYGDVIVSGAVINVASFDALPPPLWTPANYSANRFWTSNVSVRRARLERVGGFDESFTEYGWEDIELGLRLRAIGTRRVFNRFAVAFHYKPPRPATAVDARLRQARAQARTAVQLRAKHRHWQVDLATGTTPVQRALGNALRRSELARAVAPLIGGRATGLGRLATEVVAADAYYDELARAGGAVPRR